MDRLYAHHAKSLRKTSYSQRRSRLMVTLPLRLRRSTAKNSSAQLIPDEATSRSTVRGPQSLNACTRRSSNAMSLPPSLPRHAPSMGGYIFVSSPLYVAAQQSVCHRDAAEWGLHVGLREDLRERTCPHGRQSCME